MDKQVFIDQLVEILRNLGSVENEYRNGYNHERTGIEATQYVADQVSDLITLIIKNEGYIQDPRYPGYHSYIKKD